MKNETKTNTGHMTVELPIAEVVLYPEVERELLILAEEYDRSVEDVIQSLLLVFATNQIMARGEAG
jgi:hypothetical protein